MEHMPEGGTGDFQPYVSFTSENKLPAGTVIKIHSGRKQDDSTPAPEVEHRHLETSSWHFYATGENFRIVDLQGRVLHTMNTSPGTIAVSRDATIIR